MSTPRDAPEDLGPAPGPTAVERWSRRNSWSTQLRHQERCEVQAALEGRTRQPPQPLRWWGRRLRGDVMPPG